MAALIEPGKQWDSELAEYPGADFFHSHSYVGLEADRLGGNARLLTHSNDHGRLAIPLIIRPVPGAGDLCDATSAYGYNGVLAAGSASPERPEWSEPIRKVLSEAAVVCVFNRGHPFVGSGLPCTEVVGETLANDLHQSLGEYERGLRKSHRYEIRRLREQVRIESDSEGRHLELFHGLYLDTMQRRQADPAYLFPQSYIRRLIESCQHGASIELAWLQNRLAAAALFVRTPQAVHYHLSGSDPSVTHLPATKLIIDNVIRNEKNLGLRRWVHLGGGLGARRDKLHAFKAGFGGVPRPFCLTRWVIMPEVYNHLCEKQGVDPSDKSFFPRYRA